MNQIKYRSELERRLHSKTFSDWNYESTKISYIQPEIKRSYTPDFTNRIDGITYHIEAKGRFRDMAEAKKYLHIRSALKPDEKIIFVLSSRKTKMPGKLGKRKDGTRYQRQTMCEWLKQNGFDFMIEGDQFKP